jgi:hypothetical protein
MALVVDDGATLLMGEGGELNYITVYRVWDQNDPVDTTTWKQQHNIQYKDEDEDETACVRKIDPHKLTLVDLEYFVHELRNKEHDVGIFIDANQNSRQDFRPQGHAQHFQSKQRVQHRWKDCQITKNIIREHRYEQRTYQ